MTDEELAQAEKQLVRSLHGVLVTVLAQADLNKEGVIPASPVDWLSHASRRVVRSTFAAETGAALEAMGRGLYVRAMISELLEGGAKSPEQWGEEVVHLRLITDCKSLYDNIAKECSLCEDRHTALYIAALRQCVSAGPQRDTSKAAMSWVPSRCELADGLTKDGLDHLLREFMAAGECTLHEASAQEIKRRVAKEGSSQEESGFSVNTSSTGSPTPLTRTLLPS